MFITVHGLNEGHIAPYTDIEFRQTKYQTYIIMKWKKKKKKKKKSPQNFKIKFQSAPKELKNSEYNIFGKKLM